MEGVETEFLIALVAGVGAVATVGAWAWSRRGRLRPASSLPAPVPRVPAAVEVERAPEPVAVEAPADLSQRLAKTRATFLTRLGAYFGRSGESVQPAEWEAIEEALLEGDVGVKTTALLIEAVRQRSGGSDLRSLMADEALRLLSGSKHGDLDFPGAPKPLVISIVGVNGVGKTTTIGKLAHAIRGKGMTVLLGAGDTFRAAAIEQLRIWAEREGADFVHGREGSDPGAVAFDAVSAGVARGADVVLLDTAGRLHTKSNLMDELKKVHRVVKKVVAEAPHEVWMVLDGTLGQNSVNQAREFQKVLGLTGVIVTKLDGTAKGGALLAVAAELGLSIRYIGLGERAQDLVPFEPKPFINAILGI